MSPDLRIGPCRITTPRPPPKAPGAVKIADSCCHARVRGRGLRVRAPGRGKRAVSVSVVLLLCVRQIEPVKADSVLRAFTATTVILPLFVNCPLPSSSSSSSSSVVLVLSVTRPPGPPLTTATEGEFWGGGAPQHSTETNSEAWGRSPTSP